MVSVDLIYGRYDDKRNKNITLKYKPNIGETIVFDDGDSCKIIDIYHRLPETTDTITAKVVDNTDL